MSEKVTLSDLRNAIEDINKDVMRERVNGEVSNVDVLARVRSLKAKDIEYLTAQLVNIALTKLYNEVSNRKGPKSINDAGVDLFGSYRSIPKNITLVKGKKKDTSKVTFQEADLWIKSHDTKSDEKKNEEFKRLVEDCRPFKQSDDDSLEVAMKRKIEAEGLL
uniref:Uncharacterized protein n=1 Tax=Caulobacter sp. (strain K31) TaxID=366602 RepID=B0SXW7_CAUSK